MNYNHIQNTSISTTYWLNDLCHRTDGPAYITEAVKEWFQYGSLHRLDGPAVEWNNGDEEWWIRGVKYTKIQHKKYIENLKCPDYMLK